MITFTVTQQILEAYIEMQIIFNIKVNCKSFHYAITLQIILIHAVYITHDMMSRYL